MKKTDAIPECSACFDKNGIFASLKKEEVDLLGFVKTCNSYKRGDVVFYEGNRTGGIYCINKGFVKHYKTGIDGKEQIIRFSKKGEIFGYRSILTEEPACTTAKVIEDSVLCYIPANEFLKLINENSELSMRLMKLSCQELGSANQYIVDIAQKSVRERLAEVLLLLKDNFDVDEKNVLQISLSREELAGIVGTATESVIRLLSDFKKEGLIELDRRKIKLLDINTLKKISDVF